VYLTTTDPREAETFEKALKSLDLVVKTDYQLPPGATTATIAVNVHNPGDQHRLLQALDAQLDPPRRELLERLVRSRGKIPPDLLEQIRQQHTGGASLEAIANDLNKRGLTEGMKGRRWSPYRLKTVLA
jgi:hypothetical protein